MTIPSRITEEARKIAAKLVFEFETRVQSGEFNDPAGDQASMTLENLVLGALIEFGWAAEQRGREMEREETLVWQKARMRALFIKMIDKLPEEAVTALTDAMNSLSDEMEADAIRSRTTEG